MFISFEGIGGCGKSTLARRLHEYLQSCGKESILTREPGGSPGAEEIRRLILQGDDDRWSPETEILLFNAARRDHLERLVWPVRKRGAIVITDRYVDSTRVYQSAERPHLRPLVDELHRLVCIQETDLTLIIDVSPEEGMRRVAAARRDEQDRFDERGLQFQRKLAHGYHELASAYPERCVLVDGFGTVEEVFARVCDVTLPLLGL